MNYMLVIFVDGGKQPEIIGTKETILNYLYDNEGKNIYEYLPELKEEGLLEEHKIREYYLSNWKVQKVEKHKWVDNGYEIQLFYENSLLQNKNIEYGYLVLDLC